MSNPTPSEPITFASSECPATGPLAPNAAVLASVKPKPSARLSGACGVIRKSKSATISPCGPGSLKSKETELMLATVVSASRRKPPVGPPGTQVGPGGTPSWVASYGVPGRSQSNRVTARAAPGASASSPATMVTPAVRASMSSGSISDRTPPVSSSWGPLQDFRRVGRQYEGAGDRGGGAGARRLLVRTPAGSDGRGARRHPRDG